MKEFFLEEKRHLKLLPKDKCYKDYDLCTLSSSDSELQHSYGAGLIYYDPDKEEHYLIGILGSSILVPVTEEILGHHISINGKIIDWIEAHTSEDTVIVLLLQFN